MHRGRPKPWVGRWPLLALLLTPLATAQDDPFLGRAVLATKVQALGSGEVVEEQHADKLLTPASTVKLITAMALLDDLPSDLVLETPIVATGTLRNGLLDGDLVVVGAGDPSLSASAIEAWADVLVASGLRRIRGSVVVDDRLFSPVVLGEGWMWDDATTRFSPPVTALMIGGNVVQIQVIGAEPGDPVRVRGHACLAVDNRAVTVDPLVETQLLTRRLPGGSDTLLLGNTTPGARHHLTISLPDPPACAAAMLSMALEDRGVDVLGRPRLIDPDEDLGRVQVLHTHRSPPLRDLLRHMLVQSDNLYAEALMRLLDPSTAGRDFQGARPALERLMRSAGVPDDAWLLVDASGLSRYDQLTAEALVRLLRYAWQRPWGDELRDLLPSSGEGTLRARLVGGPAAERVAAKTGSMTGVFNIAGYVFPEEGEPLAFAMLSNGVVQPGSAVRYTQDLALQRLAKGPPAPEPPARGCRRR